MQSCRKHTGGLQDPRKNNEKWSSASQKWRSTWSFPHKTGAYILQMGGALRWHTPLSRPFNRGRLCKNEGRTMQNCRKHIERLQDPRKIYEKWSSASQKWRSTYTWNFPHKTGTYILQMGGALRWHTPLSRPFNRGGLCKNEGRTMQNCRKHTGGHQDPRKNNEKWSSASQKWRSTWSFPHKTGAYILQMGGALRWHTPLSRPFNRGRLCKNEGRTMQNCRQHIEGLQDPRKIYEKWSSAS